MVERSVDRTVIHMKGFDDQGVGGENRKERKKSYERQVNRRMYVGREPGVAAPHGAVAGDATTVWQRRLRPEERGFFHAHKHARTHARTHVCMFVCVHVCRQSHTRARVHSNPPPTHTRHYFTKNLKRPNNMKCTVNSLY